MTKTLSINFYNETINAEQKADFNNAITFENASLNIQYLNDSIARLEKQIAKKTEAQSELEAESDAYKAIQAELDALNVKKTDAESSKAQFETVQAENESIYNNVVNAMTIKDEVSHFGNKKDVVRTVLRVLASYDNNKLVKYAIIPAFESEKLYNCLETIHVNSKALEDGNVSMTNEVKQAYKDANSELESIIKNTFSLPFATEYTDKTRVKINAEDRKLLHDCYIKGFKNNYDVDDEGNVSFNSRTINTLVKAKKNKKTGEVKYDYTGLATTISAIVVSKYFA